MPFATRGGCRLYWKLEGEAERPPLLLLNSIGTDMGLWDRTVPHLLPHFRLLRMDTRGHGASDAPGGDYTIEDLAADAVAVLDAAQVEKVAVAGVSLGGMIAMALALEAPERVAALALICTSAELDREAWADRVAKVRAEGTSAIADLALSRFLSPAFARNNPATEQSLRSGLIAMADEGYAGAGAAIRDMNLVGRIGAIGVPTLVLSGKHDISTPFAGHGDRIARAIPSANTAEIATAHLAPIEAPAAVAEALRKFLIPPSDVEDAEQKIYEAGLVNRRRVLGDEWVEQSLRNRTLFNSDFQTLITQIAWHGIWGRAVLEERTRRLLVLAITASMGRWEEFRLHVRAGLSRDGFTREELKETLMQTAIYAGLPAGNTAFTEAAEIIAELETND